MSKIYISGKVLSGPVNGIPRYAKEVIAGIDRLRLSCDISVILPENSEYNEIQYENIKIIRAGKVCNGWDILYGEAIARRNKGFYINLASRGGLYRKSIVAIHDIRPLTWDRLNGERTKTYLLDKINFQMAARFSGTIVTVSNFSKKEISQYYHIPDDHILVSPEGWEHLLRISENENLELPEEYFFSIGSMAPHKNFQWVLNEARNYPDKNFIVSGGINRSIWNNDLNFEDAPNVMYTGYISDEDMKTYIKNAKALLFPSLYEGFGIPPLEALALGTQVIGSDIKVLHDIFGDTIHYVNTDSAAYDLDKILEEPIENPTELLQRQSWNEAVRIWKDIIIQMAG